MAGIGFNLQKILEGDSILSSVRAHFYSSLICAGPWMLSIATIFCIGFFAPQHLALKEIVFFKTSLIYIFAFSLIAIGLFHFPLTRYLADKLYVQAEDEMVPIFNTAALIVFLLQTVLGSAIFFMTDIRFSVQLLVLMNFQVIGMMWLIMIFLTSLKDYRAIAISYAIGSAVAIISSILLGKTFGLEGYYFGYFVGHLLIALLWSARVFIEFPSNRVFDPQLFVYLRGQSVLILIGFFYNCALWIDKMIFWYAPPAIVVNGALRSFPAYESATFVAYLTIIPGLSIFLMHVETDFYREYRRYYTSIMDKATMTELVNIRADMSAALRHSVSILLRYQGIFTLTIIALASTILEWLNLPLVLVPIFRLAVLGAFFHSLLLMVIILILYFDFKKAAMQVSAFFFFGNAVFTWITLKGGFSFYGYGYLSAALAALILGYYVLDNRIKNLEFHTFALQPLGRHREEEIY